MGPSEQRPCGAPPQHGSSNPLLFHTLISGAHIWDVVGPEAGAWPDLSRDVQRAVDAVAEGRREAAFSAHMVMMGESRDTSSPRILVCSKDRQIQDEVFQLLTGYGVLDKYPALEFHCSLNPPVLLAGDLLASSSQSPSSAFPAVTEHVWADKAVQEFGRRVYILRRDGAPRVATANATLFIDSKAYQTTVKHVYYGAERLSPSAMHIAASDLSLESSDSGSEADVGDDSGYDTDDSAVNEVSSDFEEPLLGHGNEGEITGLPTPRSATSSQAAPREDKGKGLEMPREADYIGGLAPQPDIQSDGRPDYMLVKVEQFDALRCNSVSIGPPGSNRTVKVTKPGKTSAIGSGRSVIVATASGVVHGTLSATHALNKPPGQTKSEMIYAIKLADGHSLEPGDSGSGVIDPTTGEIFGHIVLKHLGTSVVYMTPMQKIIDDIVRVFGPRALISFDPPRQMVQLPPDRYPLVGPLIRKLRYLSLRPAKYLMPSDAGREPLEVTEYASPKFYRDEASYEMPERRRLVSLAETARDKTTNIRPPWAGLEHLLARRKATFGYYFCSLPTELKERIIAELPVRDARNLRQVLHNEPLVCDLAILKRFFQRNPIPQLVRDLYPCQSQDIQYIQDVGHIHTVASKLAAMVAKWLQREMYLHRSHHQQRKFGEMRRKIEQRLVPPLFTLLHFFEKYSQALLQQYHSQPPNLPHEIDYSMLESNIMDTYNDDILLCSHKVMKILVTYLRFILRAPSYYGSVEKFIRGYLRNPPSETVYSVILCMGGLSRVAQLAAVDNYMKRRKAADDFYTSLTNEEGGGFVSLLPSLDDVWSHTGERLLLRRKIVSKLEDIQDYRQATTELLRKDGILEDRLYKDHQRWHALSDPDFGSGGD